MERYLYKIEKEKDNLDAISFLWKYAESQF